EVGVFLTQRHRVAEVRGVFLEDLALWNSVSQRLCDEKQTFRTMAPSNALEGFGVGFAGPAFFGGGGIFYERTEVVVDVNGIEKTHPVRTRAFASRDRREIKKLTRVRFGSVRWLFLLHVVEQ
ncbi:hypothetical protein, partial [Roseibacillus ishigakijimensis]|uniref:hypothetical protein n=1 Tax=Roseibacillus ishigakijimensis TaxID=454146 RepID=UPI001F2CC116